MNEKVWGARLDNTYDCEVVVNENDEYRLRIIEGDLVLYDQATNCEYEPVFGADVSDVMRWENEIITFIDSRGQA